MFFLKQKLGQKGFSHHLLLPFFVAAAVTPIGGYVVSQSHAATPPTPITVSPIDNSVTQNKSAIRGKWKDIGIISSPISGDSTNMSIYACKNKTSSSSIYN